MTELMTQIGPYPAVLADLVSSLAYKEGWRFSLSHTDRGQGSEGLTFVALVVGPDSYHPDQRRGVNHFFIVPAAAYDERSWRRWLFDRILDVETHEAMEFFRFSGPPGLREGDFRPYAPNHGPGRDPYTVHELGTAHDAGTSFRGERKSGEPQ